LLARNREEAGTMVTIVTHVELKPGTEGEWDRAMHERLRAAEGRPGWVAGQLLRPVDKSHGRVIIGTWQSREAWEAWHRDAAFRETRKQLDGLEARPAQEWWHEVVEERGLAA
jgi:heme-degrading monooxygenase HmoA